jgi:Leucine-rich repeat (LRR) protein
MALRKGRILAGAAFLPEGASVRKESMGTGEQAQVIVDSDRQCPLHATRGMLRDMKLAATRTTRTLRGFLAVTLVACTLGACSPPVVTFADPALRACVEEALYLSPGDPIVRTDLEALTELFCDGRELVSLSGLQSATNLTWLFLNGNNIADLSPLGGLTHLTVLGLDVNEIIDVTPLAGLTNLTNLGLGANAIVDVSPLAGLSSLEVLYLNDNNIVDVSPLEGLSSLDVLDLRYNAIVDVSALANLTGLSELGLTGNPVTDPSSLADLGASVTF